MVDVRVEEDEVEDGALGLKMKGVAVGARLERTRGVPEQSAEDDSGRLECISEGEEEASPAWCDSASRSMSTEDAAVPSIAALDLRVPPLPSLVLATSLDPL